ncbi:hypothetical protein U3A55_10415 [Salarchaeum sp. III]|uniref:hypothetical protein n=1 Tax=Salarchaeum sp. III TaxID=3107927 RepID=UPI002ED8C4EF
MSRAIGDSNLLSKDDPRGEPVTDYESKKVMLRAERKDRISIANVITRLQDGYDIPSKTIVAQRSTPYFGPKLLLYADGENYLLTAPGPDTQLLLWRANLNDAGERVGWKKLAEVKATFADDTPQYDLCPECGQPMQTIEHERKAAVGRCPGADV